MPESTDTAPPHPASARGEPTACWWAFLTKPTAPPCEQVAATHPTPPPLNARPRYRQRTDAPARSIPPSTSVPIRAVAIAAGSGWASLVPMGHPSGGPSPQFHCTASRALPVEPRHALPRQTSSRQADRARLWPVWQRAQSSRHGAGLRGRPQHGVTVAGRSDRAVARLSRVFPLRPLPVEQLQLDEWYAGLRDLKLARSARTRRSGAWNAPPPGCGRRWSLRANCWSWSMSAVAPWRWA